MEAAKGVQFLRPAQVWHHSHLVLLLRTPLSLRMASWALTPGFRFSKNEIHVDYVLWERYEARGYKDK